MFELDLRNRKPIYEQLIDKFKQLIISELLMRDEQLPSVRALAQELSINPNTIQKAYRELETQGYIYSIKGKGSYGFLQTNRNHPLHRHLHKVVRQTLKTPLIFAQ